MSISLSSFHSSGEGCVEAARLEAAAVLGRAHLERAQEHAAHRLGSAEAAAARDGTDRLVALLQETACRLEADALDVARRGEPRLGAESACEIAHAHVGARGHRLDRVVARDVL